MTTSFLQSTNSKIRYLALLTLLTLLTTHAWGADVTETWTASNGALGSTISSVSGTAAGTITTTYGSSNSHTWNYTRTLISGTDNVGWNANSLGAIQLGKNGGVENITFTTSNIPGTIKSISVVCASYKAKHKLSISVGGTSYYSGETPAWGSGSLDTKTGTGTSSGTITISFTDGTRALYIKSISVTYNNDSSDPVDPTATFSNGTYTIGGSNLDLSSLWTSNSSGAVTYTVTNANGTGATCTSAGSFSATTAGTCTVQASQAAVTGTYNAITKTATITVEEAPVCSYSAATSLSVGDEIIVVIPASNKQMKSSQSGGEVVDYPNEFCPDEDIKFTLVEGYEDNDFALKTIDDKYLSWTSSTTVQLADEITSTSQNWETETVNGVLLLKNKGESRYLLYYNSTNMRLYQSASQASTVQPTIYVINGCENLGQINGSLKSPHENRLKQRT